ncbi:hypothetical protein CSE_14450 [Caldisericum exile AZM16c01]|uniref:Uncharacterized protein n=1 Tax=Caldisericum exile (strain DSM 21853 / NBRC 104410 / AZM16c01) TaxID=511051 RepID=A0A7U6GFQ6_CALEA|nr:hypothetical protein CSE_14450 [Caldisericum exile AZM16c01]
MPVPVCTIVVFFAQPVNPKDAKNTIRSITTANFDISVFFIPTLLSEFFELSTFYPKQSVIKIQK